MDQLDSLQFMPEIVQLVSTLHAAYNKTLFRQNARNISVASFLSSAGVWNEQVATQIESLDRAWKRVQPDLIDYGKPPHLLHVTLHRSSSRIRSTHVVRF